MENNVENQQKDFNIQEMQKEEKQVEILYGGFWARLAAYFIDRFIVGMIMFILIVSLSFMSGFYAEAYSANETFEAIFGLVIMFFALLGNFGYFVYMTYKYQSTLGKMAVGVRVLNDEGKKPTLGDVMMREVLGKIVSNFTLKIGYLIAAFTNKKQALHDMIGKTIVVAKDQEKGVNKTVVILVNICFITFTILIILFYMFLLVALIASEQGF